MTRLALLIFRISGGNTGNIGGAERVMTEIYNNLPSDIDAELFVCENDIPSYSVTNTKPIRNINLNPLHKILKKSRLARLMLLSFDYMRELKINNIEYTLSFDEATHVINLIASRLSGKKVIIALRNNPFPPDDTCIKKLFHKILMQLIVWNSEIIISNSDRLKTYLDSKYNLSPEKIIVIYNPKDIQQIQNKMLEPMDYISTHDRTVPVILNVGRLTEQKGQWHLLRIFAELRKKMACQLIICGTGHLLEKLELLAQELNVSNDVHFQGWVNNSYKFMYSADVFVLTSLYEGQPNVLIESMICGCPVISADCPYGPAEILQNGKYGVLTKSLDSKNFDSSSPLSDEEKDILDALIKVLTDGDYKTNLSRLGNERARIFSNEKICQEYYALFRSILSASQ